MAHRRGDRGRRRSTASASTATARSCSCTRGPAATAEAIGPIDRRAARARRRRSSRSTRWRRCREACRAARRRRRRLEDRRRAPAPRRRRSWAPRACRRDRARRPTWRRIGEDASWSRVGVAIDAAPPSARGRSGAPSRSPSSGRSASPAPTCPADDRRLARWLRANGWADRPMLRNDTFAVLRAGTDRPWGVAVVCGYGTNCTGVAPDGRTYRFPAVGPISGDWGGGLELGGAALWHAIRAEDGRGQKTALATVGAGALRAAHAPGKSWRRCTSTRSSEERVAELAPLVFEAAADGDARRAHGSVDRQADEIVTMATTAIRRLRMSEARRRRRARRRHLPQPGRRVLRPDRRRRRARSRRRPRPACSTRRR